MALTLSEKLWRLENDPAWTTVQLPITPGHETREELLVERVDNCCFRIASSPGMLEGLAADDVVEIVPNEPSGYRLVRRGGNLCIHVFADAEKRTAIQAMLVEKLGQLGGWLDGTMGNIGLCFTVPAASGFSQVEAIMRDVVGEEWSYANVYDSVTAQPLNWWLKSESMPNKALQQNRDDVQRS
jgi:hypothetical protein